MTPSLLAADSLLSVLAGLALLFLRSTLARRTGLSARLRGTLRFGTLTLGLFYLARPLSWYGAGWFFDSLLAIIALLAGLAVLLIAEAVVQRHTPRFVKWLIAIAVPLLTLGAFVAVDHWRQGFLAALLGFHMAILVVSGWMLIANPGSRSRPERDVTRIFGALILVTLPMIALESALLNDDGKLHLSALVVLTGVWLLFRIGQSWTGGTLILTLLAVFAALALISATVFANWQHDLTAVFAPVQMGVLLFASIVTSAFYIRRTALEDALAGLVTLPGKGLTREAVLETLRDRDVMAIAPDALNETDLPVLRKRLEATPLWSAALSDEKDDADQALADIAQSAGANHLLCERLEPISLIAFSLDPSETGEQTRHLLAALSRRLTDRASND